MRSILFILFSLCIIGCTSNENNQPYKGNPDLMGQWKLIEQLSDPGDGSGVFNPLESNRKIEFFSNGTVTVNGELCHMDSEVGEKNTGRFLALENNDYYDGEIIPDNCDYEDTKLYYNLEGTNLIIRYLCIEGCGQKFKKL